MRNINRLVVVVCFLCCCVFSCKSINSNTSVSPSGENAVPQYKYFRDLNVDNSKIINYRGYKCYDATEEECEAEYTVFTAVNLLRTSRGLPVAKHNMALSYIARSWSKEQVTRGNISHDWFAAGETANILKYLISRSFLDVNARFQLTGENVAANSEEGDGIQIGKKLFSQWKESAGHCHNMVQIDQNFDSGVVEIINTSSGEIEKVDVGLYLGVGVITGSKGQYKVWGTQLFARLRSGVI